MSCAGGCPSSCCGLGYPYEFVKRWTRRNRDLGALGEAGQELCLAPPDNKLGYKDPTTGQCVAFYQFPWGGTQPGVPGPTTPPGLPFPTLPNPGVPELPELPGQPGPLPTGVLTTEQCAIREAAAVEAEEGKVIKYALISGAITGIVGVLIGRALS
jgi:hypothetical protein